MSILTTLKFVTTHPLNKRRPDRGLIGFARWQIGSRLVSGQVVHHWVNGARFIAHPGESGLTGNIYCGLHEFADMAYLLHTLNADDVFVDVGANVGSYTILAGAARGAKVYCFEPVPSTFVRLMDNIRLNNLSERVQAFNMGLADKQGELAFTSTDNCVNHVAIGGEKASNVVRIKVMPLDELSQVSPPSIMKIDVEGFEAAVLAGARATLDRVSLHSLIVELNGSGKRYGFDEEDILSALAERGFMPCRYDPFARTLQTLDGVGSEGNTLFVRNVSEVRKKIDSAPRTYVGNEWL